jgi:hypothetical protein
VFGIRLVSSPLKIIMDLTELTQGLIRIFDEFLEVVGAMGNAASVSIEIEHLRMKFAVQPVLYGYGQAVAWLAGRFRVLRIYIGCDEAAVYGVHFG